jgi:hypothetical protein
VWSVTILAANAFVAASPLVVANLLDSISNMSLTATAKLFGKSHPHLQMMPGAWIEIVEIMPIPGM